MEEDGQGQRGYPLKEAAARLGISENALRKRVKAGKVPADLVQGPRGPEYRVWLEDDSLASPQASLAGGAALAPILPEHAQIALQDAVTAAIGDSLASIQASLAETVREHAEGQGERLEAMETTLAQLQASLASMAADRKEVERLRAELATMRRRPWWKRIF